MPILFRAGRRPAQIKNSQPRISQVASQVFDFQNLSACLLSWLSFLSGLLRNNPAAGSTDQQFRAASGNGKHRKPLEQANEEELTALGAPQRKSRIELISGTSHFLRVPLNESRQILKTNRRFLAEVEARRNRVQSPERLRRHLKRWESDSVAAFRELQAGDPRSRILATYHFGDFAFGLNYLLRQDLPDRECIILTERISDDAYFENMQRAFGDERTTPAQQWLIKDTRPSRLAEKIQQCKITLVTFCDLPPSFGATTEVDFLGRKARFPRGAASLALRFALPILPVISFYREGKHHIAIAPQLEPRADRDESKPTCLTRLSQRLADHLQEFLLRSPEQWRFISTLPAYYTEVPTVTAAQNENETRTPQAEADYSAPAQHIVPHVSQHKANRRQSNGVAHEH